MFDMLFRVVACLALMGLVSASYNDTFARTEVLYLTAAAYSLTPSLCLNRTIPDAKVGATLVKRALIQGIVTRPNSLLAVGSHTYKLFAVTACTKFGSKS